MENAVEALKMGGAAMLFILAFSITMIMFGQCRTTADAVITNLQIKNFMQGVKGEKENITRTVGLETVIPTIYRYGNQDSSLRVVIKNAGGTELQVFDVGIEETVSQGIDNTKVEYTTYIHDTYNTPSADAFMFDAPWVNNTELELERINCYITGDEFHLIKTDPAYQHIYRDRGNYLLKYADKSFKETYTEYRKSGRILIDEFGEEIIQQQPSGTFKIITYQIMN